MFPCPRRRQRRGVRLRSGAVQAQQPSARRRGSTVGIVLNAVAILAALLAFPYLVWPLLELGFVGLVGVGPVALAAFLVGIVVIDIAPLVGLVTAILGRARWLGFATGSISIVSLVAVVSAVAFLDTKIDFFRTGRDNGPQPADCKPAAHDGRAHRVTSATSRPRRRRTRSA